MYIHMSLLRTEVLRSTISSLAFNRGELEPIVQSTGPIATRWLQIWLARPQAKNIGDRHRSVKAPFPFELWTRTPDLLSVDRSRLRMYESRYPRYLSSPPPPKWDIGPSPTYLTSYMRHVRDPHISRCASSAHPW